MLALASWDLSFIRGKFYMIVTLKAINVVSQSILYLYIPPV